MIYVKKEIQKRLGSGLFPRDGRVTENKHICFRPNIPVLSTVHLPPPPAQVFLVQNLYDAAQVKVSNVLDDLGQGQLTSDQWVYLLDLGHRVKDTLDQANSS